MDMDIKNIQELIKLVTKSDLGEVRIKEGDFQIIIRTRDYISAMRDGNYTTVMAPSPQQQMAAPQSTSQPQVPAAENKAAKDSKGAEPSGAETGHITMKSPMIG